MTTSKGPSRVHMDGKHGISYPITSRTNQQRGERERLIALARRIDGLVEARRYSEIPRLSRADHEGLVALCELTPDQMQRRAKDLASTVYVAALAITTIDNPRTDAAPVATRTDTAPPSQKQSARDRERQAMLDMIEDSATRWWRRTVAPLRADREQPAPAPAPEQPPTLQQRERAARERADRDAVARNRRRQAR